MTPPATAKPELTVALHDVETWMHRDELEALHRHYDTTVQQPPMSDMREVSLITVHAVTGQAWNVVRCLRYARPADEAQKFAVRLTVELATAVQPQQPLAIAPISEGLLRVCREWLDTPTSAHADVAGEIGRSIASLMHYSYAQVRIFKGNTYGQVLEVVSTAAFAVNHAHNQTDRVFDCAEAAYREIETFDPTMALGGLRRVMYPV